MAGLLCDSGAICVSDSRSARLSPAHPASRLEFGGCQEGWAKKDGKHGPCQMRRFGKSIFVPIFRKAVSFLPRITKIVAQQVVNKITIGTEHILIAYTVDFVH